MASLKTSDEKMVHETEKVVITGAHILFTSWTKSQVLLDFLTAG